MLGGLGGVGFLRIRKLAGAVVVQDARMIWDVQLLKAMPFILTEIWAAELLTESFLGRQYSGHRLTQIHRLHS